MKFLKELDKCCNDSVCRIEVLRFQRAGELFLIDLVKVYCYFKITKALSTLYCIAVLGVCCEQIARCISYIITVTKTSEYFIFCKVWERHYTNVLYFRLLIHIWLKFEAYEGQQRMECQAKVPWVDCYYSKPSFSYLQHPVNYSLLFMKTCFF